MDEMTIYAFFCLSDYWAKLQSQKSATATCEGNQVGISAHGMMFIFRNLSLAERAAVDAEYGEQDWTQFGPATDEPGGLSFLEEHHPAISDDAKQVPPLSHQLPSSLLPILPPSHPPSLPLSLAPSLPLSLAPSLPRSLSPSLARSLTHSLAHSLTHSLTDSPTQSNPRTTECFPHQVGDGVLHRPLSQQQAMDRSQRTARCPPE